MNEVEKDGTMEQANANANANGNDNSPLEEFVIKIVSASYGPCEGQRLLTGEWSNDPAAKKPYTRDVTPILRALLQLQEHSKLDSNVVDDDDDPHWVRLKAIARGGMKRTAITIQALHDGWNTMNVIFGDACPGTSKKLYIHYVILNNNNNSNKNPGQTRKLQATEVHHVSFAENEPVILRRRLTFYQEDSKLQQATARVLAKKPNLFASHHDSTIKSNQVPSEVAEDEDEETLLVARRMGRSQSIDEFAQLSVSPVKSLPQQPIPRLRSATFEIVLPIVLPFLLVPERVQCRLVCRLWRNIVKDWGVAPVIDRTDPTLQHTFTRPFLRGILSHSYSSLHSLRLSDYQELCPEDLLPSLPHLRKLRVLDVSRCTQLGDETLQALAQHVSGTLEVLYIKGLMKASDAGLIAICQACSRLKVLEVSYIPMTDASGVAMGRLTNLRALYMRDNYKLTNRSIDVITANCTKLNQLTLWGCIKIKHLSFDGASDAYNGLSNGMALVPEHPECKLVSLNLWGCFKLGDDLAVALGHMQNLRSLIMSECHKLTDQFVIGIAHHLPQLVHLHLRYCKRLTDNSVHAIASGMQNLSTLDLSFCSRVTSQSICSLLESRHETLSELRLQECRQLEIARDPEHDDDNRNRGRRNRAGKDGLAILKSLRSPLRTNLNADSSKECNLSMIDLRCCGGQPSIDTAYPENDQFVRGMSSLHFEQRTPGFFTRPARWNASTQARLQDQLSRHSSWSSC